MAETLWKACGRAAGQLAGPMANYRRGDLAALRKLATDPDRPPLTAPYWRLVGRLEPPVYDPARDPGADDPDGAAAQARTERRLALALGGMALLAFGMNQRGFHDYGVPLGRALARQGYSEKRLLALLAADGDVFEDLFIRMIRFLAHKHQGLDWSDALRLLLGGPRDQDNIRRKIARDYHFAAAMARDPEA